MKIQPIVEGHGEIEAVPILLRRLLDEAGVYNLQVGRPIRRPRSDFNNEQRFRTAVKIAKKQPDIAGVLVIFDSDDDCPAEVNKEMAQWLASECYDIPWGLALVKREFEAWFLATIESLRGYRGVRSDASSHANPEGPRDAKGELESRLEYGRYYSETVDQAGFTSRFDLALAHARCRSFKKLAKEFGNLVRGLRIQLGDWPPSNWTSDYGVFPDPS